jgi:hypothetical protein
MFSSVIKSVNSNSSAPCAEAVSGLNKRSKVCDADSSGRVNPNCKR